MARPNGWWLHSRSGDGAAGEQRTACGRNVPQRPVSLCSSISLLVGIALAFGLSQGCTAAAIIIPMVGSAAATATKSGVSYTLENRAYKTFAAPVGPVRENVLAALEDMAFVVESQGKNDEGETIRAKGDNREVEVTLEAITPRATRVRVVVDEGAFWKDRATAQEIVEQTGRGVDVVVTAARAARGRILTPTARQAPPDDVELRRASAITWEREPWDPQRWREGFRASPVPPGTRTQVVGPAPFIAPVSHSLISHDTLSPEERLRRCPQDYLPFPWPLRREGRESDSCGRVDVRGAIPVP